jgi:hypothetical protein
MVAIAWFDITCASFNDVTSERLKPTTMTAGPGNEATVRPPLHPCAS